MGSVQYSSGVHQDTGVASVDPLFPCLSHSLVFVCQKVILMASLLAGLHNNLTHTIHVYSSYIHASHFAEMG